MTTKTRFVRFSFSGFYLVILTTMSLIFSPPNIGSAGGQPLPSTIFRQVDIEAITGLNLNKLNVVLESFLHKNGDAPGMPTVDSLQGVWLFGFANRISENDNKYRSTSDLSKELQDRSQSPSEKYFYREVQFVWDLNKIHVGEWTFIINEDHTIRGGTSGFIKLSDGNHKPVNLWIIVDVSREYVVKGWGVDEVPIY